MGRKVNEQSKKKQPKPVPVPIEAQSSSQSQHIDEEQYDQNLSQFQGEQEDFDNYSVLLKKIQDKINDSQEGEKLSWGAIYTIKQKQAVLNQQMTKQLNAIKDKYQKLKHPLIQKISDAIAGKQLQKSLYAQNELIKTVNLNKVKPTPIADYWGKVFESSGLIHSEVDIDVLDNIKLFKIELFDSSKNHIKLHMEFNQNDYFENKSFDLQISGNPQNNDFQKKLSEPIKYKGKKSQKSLFTTLFDDSDNQQLAQIVLDLYRAYVSSTYLYFIQEQQFMGHDQNDQEDEGDESGEAQGEDSEDDEDVKPTKKVKPNPALQKPECKNQ